ncbi:hypothetical protein KJ693_00815 [bacterium]|nr:hypothetical protein [bacterium]MBU1613831.1 hypothetical protein [bacterium]
MSRFFIYLSQRRRSIRDGVDIILFNPDNPVKCLPSKGVNLRPSALLIQAERNEGYWSVCELVKNRLDIYQAMIR